MTTTPRRYAVRSRPLAALAAGAMASLLTVTACTSGADSAAPSTSNNPPSSAAVAGPLSSTDSATATTPSTSSATIPPKPSGSPTAPTGSSSGAPKTVSPGLATPGGSGDPAGLQLLQNPIPYPQSRQDEMATYSSRHYGISSAKLDPKVIVLHFTDGSTWQSAWSVFAADTKNLGELPGTCAHYVIDQVGVVHQLAPLTLQCRHTIGLNHVAIGIEMVQATAGHSSLWAEQQILSRPAQVNAAIGLVRQLQKQYGIATSDVIGHAMANGHPLFVDKQGWRNDHTDWSSSSVATFRAWL